MARKIEIDLENPILQAGAIAKSIVEDSKSEFNDVSKKYIDDLMIDNLVVILETFGEIIVGKHPVGYCRIHVSK